MARYNIFDDVETFPDATFQADSFQLEEFRSGDFSSMTDELNRIIPNNENIELRHFPIVTRVAKDKGRPYVRKPHRMFKGIKQAHQRLLERTYRDLGIDLFMLRTAQRQAPQNAILVAPVPAKSGRIRFFSFLPGEVSVERDDPLEQDARHVTKVTIRCPVKTKGGITVFGRLVFTATEAYLESGSSKAGVFAGWGHGTRNPLGYIPCVVARTNEAPNGWFWPALNQALGSMQIAIDVALSDIDMTCRFQAHGKEVLVGPGAKLAAAGMSKVRSGADTITAIDGGGDGEGALTYEMVNSEPAIDKYLSAITFQLQLLEQLEYITPGTLTPAGTGDAAITGRGKEQERRGELEETNRVESMWRRFEDELGWLVADLISLKGLVTVERPDTDVDFKYVEVPDNDLQATQSSVLRYLVGRDSPGEQVAREENLANAEEGWKVVEDRLRRNARFLASLRGKDVPGLDSIAGFAAETGREPAAAEPPAPEEHVA